MTTCGALVREISSAWTDGDVAELIADARSPLWPLKREFRDGLVR